MTGEQEYQWSRPGCFKCKEPIGNRDYVKVNWVGKTWEWSINLCLECWQPAHNVLDVAPAVTRSPGDPTHGRNVAV